MRVVVSRMYLVLSPKYIQLTTIFHLTLMMTSAQVVETSVTITNNNPSQDYTHPDNQTTLFHSIFIDYFN